MTPIERHKAPENPGPNKISFIFYYHAERRYPSDDPLFTLLEDSDLILSELVGLSTKARRKFENDLNLVLLAQENLTPDQIKARGALLTRYQISLDTDEQIALHFAGTGKTILFIDTSSEDTEVFNLFQEGLVLQKSVNSALISGDIHQARINYQGYLEMLIREVYFRNRLVARQILELIETGVGNDRRIAILQGYLHSQMVGLLQTPLPPHCQSQVHFLIPTLTPEIKLAEDLLLGRTVSETDYLRSLLSDYILLPALSFQTETDNEIDLLIELCSLVSTLSDDQVESALNQFSLIYRQNLTRLLGSNRRPSPKNKQSYTPFAFAQTSTSLLQTVRRWTKK